ncbi:MAG: class I SAM-dependent methyltransferase [Solirubrobacteraceae bacterium]
MATPRRLLFGEVAELYDESRPAYPAALIDDLLADLPAGTRVLEVGAGTGKATTMVADRGARVLAIEPSAGMADVLRRNCAAYPGVRVVESDFERWDPFDERYPLLYSAQAWHWIDPAARYERAAAALSSGGLLAAFWNRPAWGDSPLRAELARVYAEIVPELVPDGPLHPANLNPDGDDDWTAEIGAAAGFEHPELRTYEFNKAYSADDYIRLLATLSEIRLLDVPDRDALLAGVHDAIEAHGGTLSMPMLTRLCLARRRAG